MSLALARGIVLVAAISLGLFALYGMLSPEKLLRIVRQILAAPWGIYFAVIIRLALGAAMLVTAPVSPYPAAFVVVGWIAIAAAVVAVLLGRRRLLAFAEWWIERFSPAGTRVWLVIALGFAAFLFYGVI